MSDIMSNRNATGSWHGYTHQSKVGVLLVLRKIKELLEKDEPLDNWIVEFESAEDIDIKHDSKVDSRHQVKAYKDGNYPNDYKDVLQEAYPINNGKMEKVTQAFQYRAMKEDKSPGEIEVDENSRYLHTIVEVRGFGLTKEEFKKISSVAKYIPNPNKVQLYQYEHNKYYCDFSKNDEQDKLEEYCIKEIKEILVIEASPFVSFGEIHKSKYLAIVDTLDNRVREAHLEELGVGYPTLSFKEVFEITISNEAQERTNTQVMRQAFMRIWDDYVEELQVKDSQQDTPRLDEGLRENRRSIIQEIYLLDDDEFKQLIIYLNPDQKNIDNLSDTQILTTHMQADSLKDIMYNCLLNITEQIFDRDYLGYKNGKYTLSLINREKASIRSVIESMSRNSEYLNKIYERNYLINGQINNQKITPGVNKEKDKMDSNWRNEKKKIHIMNPEMEFITAKEAIKKINEG